MSFEKWFKGNHVNEGRGMNEGVNASLKKAWNAAVDEAIKVISSKTNDEFWNQFLEELKK